MLINVDLIKLDKITKSKVESIFDKIEKSKDTMGTLLKSVKKAYTITDIHINELEIVLNQRNYLSHYFFKDNSLKFYSDEGKLEMIKDCIDFIDKSKIIDKELEKYYLNYRTKLGISDELLKKEYQLCIKEEKDRVKKE